MMKPEHIDRNIRIFENVLSGKTLKEAGLEYGLSRERVRQIFARIQRLLYHPKRLNGDIPPRDKFYCYTLDEYRKDEEFWIKQLEKYKREISS